MVQALERSGGYRVLRRLDSPRFGYSSVRRKQLWTKCPIKKVVVCSRVVFDNTPLTAVFPVQHHHWAIVRMSGLRLDQGVSFLVVDHALGLDQEHPVATRPISHPDEKLVSIARSINERISEPDLARYAIVEAWSEAASAVLPSPPTSREDLAEALEIDAIWTKLKEIQNILTAAPEDDPVRRRALEPLMAISLVPHEVYPKLILALDPPRNKYPHPELERALGLLRASGATAATEIDAALDQIRKFQAHSSAFAERMIKARTLGRTIAHAIAYPRIPQAREDQ